jgi:transposase
MWPTGDAWCVNLSAVMRTNVGETTEKAAATKVETAIKLGLDVHAAQITVCRQIDGSLPQPAQKMSWERCLEWIGQQAGSGAKIYSCYEAGPCGYRLHRLLTSLGVTNYVVAPQRWDEHGQRVKTDKRDARELCGRLDRFVRGNTHAFALVRVPTPEQEQRRALARERGRVMKERQRCIVRGHGLMLAQGVQAPSGWWESAVWPHFCAELPAWLREHVGLWQRQAVRLDAEAAQLSGRVEDLARGVGVPKGLGALTAAILATEIMDWKRFHNRRQVASYTGLCPSEDSSGQRRRQGAVTKHGNPRVRHALVEAVWRLQQWQPHYKPLHKVRAAQGARARKRAAVAAARRLAVDLWRIHTGRCPGEKLGLLMNQPV